MVVQSSRVLLVMLLLRKYTLATKIQIDIAEYLVPRAWGGDVCQL